MTMLAIETNNGKNCVEIYGDREGIKLLIKRLSALLSSDPPSYIAFGQGLEHKNHRDNTLADYYSIFLCEPMKESDNGLPVYLE